MKIRTQSTPVTFLLVLQLKIQLPKDRDFAGAESSYIEKFPLKPRKCNTLDQNQNSPYVVIILYKTSGSFLGLGGIISSKTVITADVVIRKTFSNPKELLIVAGYLSPWWGRNAQIRTAIDLHPNDYEVVLVEVHPEFRFSTHVQPIKIKKSKSWPDKKYEKRYSVFGIQVGTTFVPGDQISKTMVYSMVKHTPTEKNDCGKDYKDLTPEFNDSVHICFSPNGSFCSGCVGSPVVGTPKDSLIVRLVGIVVRSNCLLEGQRVLMVNVPLFADLVSIQDHFVPV